MICHIKCSAYTVAHLATLAYSSHILNHFKISTSTLTCTVCATFTQSITVYISGLLAMQFPVITLITDLESK